MTVPTVLVLSLTVFLTSALSGVLGMGGGMMLMAVLTGMLPVAMAMSLHGIIQATSNGSRFLLLIRHVHWRSLPLFLLGTACATALFHVAAFQTEEWLVYLFLGLLPFVPAKWTSAWKPDVTKPGHGFVGGVAVTLLQLVAGASGPLLDMYYQNAPLERRQVVATKAATQMLGHTIKVWYYLPLVTASELAPAGMFVGLALLGSWLGTIFLARISEAEFQRYFRLGIRVVGGSCILRGIAACPWI